MSKNRRAAPQERQRLLLLGRAHYQAGDLDGALEHLNAALQVDDCLADAHNMLAVIKFQRGEIADAQRHFERALELYPRYIEAALNLSICCNERGWYDDAREVYRRPLGDEGGSRVATRRLDEAVLGLVANLHVELGEVYLAIGAPERAVRELTQAAEACPRFPDVRLKRATTERDLGHVDAALDALVALRRDFPAFLPGRLQLGVTYWLKGYRDRARAEWELVKSQCPDDPLVEFYLAALNGSKAEPPRASAEPESPEDEPYWAHYFCADPDFM